MTEARLSLTATYTGSVTGTPGLVDLVSDVNGYTHENFPTAQRPEGYDTDQDGMPDEWEKAHGLDPNDAADALAYSLDERGMYQNIELYCNSIVESIMRSGNEGARSSQENLYIFLRGILGLSFGGACRNPVPHQSWQSAACSLLWHPLLS